jgi:hypothetical protein
MKQGHKRSAPLAEDVNLTWRLCVPGDVSRSGFLPFLGCAGPTEEDRQQRWSINCVKDK